MKIYLGPAGSPVSSSIDGVAKVKELGLNAMEVEFTYGVRMSNSLAKEIGELAKKLKIKLSVHAPYYINLASIERKKIDASKQRIIESCERAYYLGANPVVFHSGFYGKKHPSDVFLLIKDAIDELQKRTRKWKIQLAPETTGKHSQFGSLEELLQLRKALKCEICVDFAHLYARNGGKINYGKILDKLPKKLHIHFSGVEFTDKGERRHLVMGRPRFRPLAKELIKRKISATIISESPVTWRDSLKQKKVFKSLGLWK
jgi:deoxyribonuclease-4